MCLISCVNMDVPIADASLSVLSLINKFRESFINLLVDFFAVAVHSFINIFPLKFLRFYVGLRV